MNVRRPGRSLLALLLGAVATACSSSSPTTPPPDPAPGETIVALERYRDAGTGRGVPVLTERGTDFDGLEVDSPEIVFDAARAGGDTYLLYYEATSLGGVSTIGVVTSSTSDLSARVVDRQQVVGLGAPGSGYDVAATDPSVIVEDFATTHRYRMWFEGRSGAAGSVSTVLTAVSDDGLSWRNFTACTGLTASYATVRVADPDVVHDGSIYRMVFEAQGAGLGLGAIGYAESSDGIAWTVRDVNASGGGAAPVLRGRGGVVFDAVGVGSPGLVFDATLPADSPWRWQLWYEAADQFASTQNTIGVAHSVDGRQWTVASRAALEPASDSLVPLPFDSGDLEHPTVLVDPSISPTVSGHYLLFYTGDGEANLSGNRVGLARGELFEVPPDSTL